MECADSFSHIMFLKWCGEGTRQAEGRSFPLLCLILDTGTSNTSISWVPFLVTV